MTLAELKKRLAGVDAIEGYKRRFDPALREMWDELYSAAQNESVTYRASVLTEPRWSPYL